MVYYIIQLCVHLIIIHLMMNNLEKSRKALEVKKAQLKKKEREERIDMVKKKSMSLGKRTHKR